MLRYVFLGFALTAAIVGFKLATVEPGASHLPTNDPPLSDPTPREPTYSPPITNKVKVKHSIAKKDPVDLSEWAIEPYLENEFAAENSADDYAEFAADSTPEQAWTEPDTPPDLPDKYQQLGLTASAINFNQEKISSLRSGDQIELSIPQLSQTFSMTVEKVTRHQNGDKSLTGYIQDENLPYSVVMTQGENITFATINTPEGSFTLEAEGDEGWITSAADLDFLIDPAQDDFQLPDFSN